MRIAKRIADSGVASRREAEAMILSGRVAVDGKRLASPAYNVEEGTAITLDGSPLPRAKPLELYLFHKPREVLTARIDERGQSTHPTYSQAHPQTHSYTHTRTCFADLLPRSLARLKPVGRLDFLSEGLLLLTTSGELARYFELPQNAWQRRYRLRLHASAKKQAGEQSSEQADKQIGEHSRAGFESLKQGIEIEGVRYRPVSVVVRKPQHKSTSERTNFWIEATLTEGKNRELRKIMQKLGYGVSRLIRTHYGPFALEGLAQGAHKRVPAKELRTLLGEKFSAF